MKHWTTGVILTALIAAGCQTSQSDQPVATVADATATTKHEITPTSPSEMSTTTMQLTTTSHFHPQNTFTTTTGPTTPWTPPLDILTGGSALPALPPPGTRRYNANQYGCHSDGRCLDDYDEWCDESDLVYVEQTGEEVCWDTYEWLIDDLEYDE